MIDERPKLQRVTAAGVKDIVAPREYILLEVRRSHIGSQRRDAANVQGSNFHAGHKRVLRADKPGWRRIRRVGPAKGHPERAEQRRRKNMVLRKRRKRTAAVALGTEL